MVNHLALPASPSHAFDDALWHKLQALPLDRLPEEPLPASVFTKRLAQETGWSLAYAIRVTGEYRRFLYLAAKGAVSPSHAVDHAWHLHLIYARAYHEGLGALLGRPLTHTPSTGDADHARLKTLYAKTLARYETTFGEAPPTEIWPSRAATATVSTWRRGVGKLFRAAPFGVLVAAIFGLKLWIAALMLVGVWLLLRLCSGDAQSWGLDIANGGEGGDGDSGACGGGCGGD